MSIYGTWLAIDDGEHEPGVCAVWKRASEKKARKAGTAAWNDEGAWVKSGKPCDCKKYPPYVYQGSHVNPTPDDAKGGYLLACAIPDFCHPDAVRDGSYERDQGYPVNYLRLSVGEDPATYHGMQPGHATLVLDRRQVKRLHRTLTAWLKTHPTEGEAEMRREVARDVA